MKVFPRVHIAVLAALLLCGASALFADAFASGEELFMRNEPEKAIPFLEAANRERPDEEKAYYYLGIAYLQVKRIEDAISIFKKGAAKSSGKSYDFYYNIGLCYAMQGKNAFAKEWYDQSIKEREDYAPVYLNRADAFMSMKEYQAAVSDYREYLRRVPDSPQKSNIEKIIALIEADMAEAARKKAEEAARLAAEEARRQQILADVAASLKDSAADTQSLSAGNEGAEGYSDESELAD